MTGNLERGRDDVYGYRWEGNDRLITVEERGAGSLGPEDYASSSVEFPSMIWAWIQLRASDPQDVKQFL